MLVLVCVMKYSLVMNCHLDLVTKSWIYTIISFHLPNTTVFCGLGSCQMIEWENLLGWRGQVNDLYYQVLVDIDLMLIHRMLLEAVSV